MAIDLKSNYLPIYLDLRTMEINGRYWGKMGDTGRGFDVFLIDNGVIVNPTNEIVTFYCEKPDNTQVWIDGLPLENKFRIELTNQVFAIQGDVHCEISVISQGVRKTTEDFVIESVENLRETAIESVSQLGRVDETIDTLESYEEIVVVWSEAEAIRVSNEDTRIADETTRGSNETARQGAETARVDAEGLRVTAENARVTVESDRVTAESGRVTAEGIRESQETIREGNETVRLANETERNVYVPFNPLTPYKPTNKVVYYGNSYVNKVACTGILPTDEDYWLCVAEVVVGNVDGGGAEDVYDIVPVQGAVYVSEVIGAIEGAEALRVIAEGARETSEGSRVTAEGLRVTADADRTTAEGLRATAESGRVTAEGLRVTAEGTRVSQEDARVTAEGLRVTAESARVTAEGLRDTAEGTRESNESARETAEGVRESQEATRQTNTTTAISNINTASDSTKLIWKAPVATYADIATTYPTPVEGWRVECTDTKIGYRYTVDTWVQIANSGIGYVPANASTAQNFRLTSDEGTQKSSVVGSIDDAKTAGRYYVSTDYNTGNMPCAYGTMDVIKTDSGDVFQTVYEIGNEFRVFERGLWGGNNVWQPWRILSNIYATGSNENGKYVMFSDGSAIAYSPTGDVTGLNVASGATHIMGTFALPMTFNTHAPNVFICGFPTDAGGSALGIPIGCYAGLTDVSGVHFKNTSAVTINKIVGFGIFAWGRWKA